MGFCDVPRNSADKLFEPLSKLSKKQGSGREFITYHLKKRKNHHK